MKKTVHNFTLSQKEKIFKRDGYRCVMCGLGRKDGIALYASYVKSQNSDRLITIDDGLTLCSQHNDISKTMQPMEAGKEMFIHLYETAKKKKNKKFEEFCYDILKVYEDYDRCLKEKK